MHNEIEIPYPSLLAYIGRTKDLLEACEEPVRILVYGQSISKQAWWLYVKHALEARYPEVELDMRCTAIGGFHSTRLLRTVESDVRTFYPDLVIFHDYGPEDDYEAIIRIIRSTTVAEIAIQTDHFVETQNNEFHDKHCYEWLPRLCETYHLALIGVRKNWLRYLEQTGANAKDLLRDNVHLNELGNHLMADIVMAHWDAAPTENPDTPATVHDYVPGMDFNVKRGELQLDFAGNRVDVLVAASGCGDDITVLVDGEDPQNWPEVYVAESPWIHLHESRPSKVGMPNRIIVGESPEADEWVMIVTKVIDNGRIIEFDIRNERHGIANCGSSDALYVESHGLLQIEPEDWFIRETPVFYHMLDSVEVGEHISWRVLAMADDINVLPSPHTVSVFQGKHAHEHKLVLKGKDSVLQTIRCIRVYTPFIQPS